MNIEYIPGVTVLRSTVVNQGYVGTLIGAIIIVLLTALIFFIAYQEYKDNGTTILLEFTIIIGSIFIIIACSMGINSLKNIHNGRNHVNRYDVLVEDNDAIKTLYDNFKIIDGKGNIYTIEETYD